MTENKTRCLCKIIVTAGISLGFGIAFYMLTKNRKKLRDPRMERVNELLDEAEDLLKRSKRRR